MLAVSSENATKGKAGKQGNLPPQLLSLEVRERASLEDPVLVGSIKVKGDLPVKRDFHAGEQVTVSIADADGVVVATGLCEIQHPAFKDVTMRGVGPIGTERVHTAEFNPDL